MTVMEMVRPGTVPVMETGGDVGREIRARRMAHGMDVKDLAKYANVSRTTVAAVEAGAEARSGTIGKILAALDRFDEETSGPYDDEDKPRTVTYRVQFGNQGAHVTVEGPVDDIPELEASVRRLLSEMREADPDA